ncbi:2-oxoglutarate ferredoxin oxidoreductase subunit delta, partial [Dysosmobacter welbionis]
GEEGGKQTEHSGHPERVQPDRWAEGGNLPEHRQRQPGRKTLCGRGVRYLRRRVDGSGRRLCPGARGSRGQK